MVVGIHGKPLKPKTAKQVVRLLDLLKQSSVTIALSDHFAKALHAAGIDISASAIFQKEESGLPPMDCFISIGGDGTLLDSLTYIGRRETPILGVNAGRLGFLATTNADDAEVAVRRLLAREYSIDKRSLIEIKSSLPRFENFPYALNDFAIMRNDASSMITVRVWADGEMLNVYWADGLIISTPTGSTGYSLSCGGSLLTPDCNNFIITAISSHNLGARSVILSDHVKILLQAKGRHNKLLMSADSRREMVDASIVEVSLQKANFWANLVQFSHQHYFKTLRQKLNWGIDNRN